MGEISEVTKLTNTIVEAIDTADMEIALTSLSNIMGQVICAQVDGNISKIQFRVDVAAQNIKNAALNKLIYENSVRLAAERDE